MMQETRLREERSLGDLFTDLTREITTLVRQEATLAVDCLWKRAAKCPV